QEHVLAFGEEQSEPNRFSRATFVRLDQQPEIVRLAPGRITILDRPQKDYQHPRLFPHERVAKDRASREKIQQLAGRAVPVKSADGTIELAREGASWEIVS